MTWIPYPSRPLWTGLCNITLGRARPGKRLKESRRFWRSASLAGDHQQVAQTEQNALSAPRIKQMAFAELTDVRCYYEILGTGEPIVLIPGLGSTCELWDGAAQELAKTHSVIAFDNRGLGKSISKRNPQS